MTVQLPANLGSSVEAAVRSGLFGSAEELVSQAVWSFLEPPPSGPGVPEADPILRSMREAADELDAIVADSNRRRDAEARREVAVE